MFYPDDGSDEPRTHALIIGVGGYPHVADGETPNPEIDNRFGDLKQLTSAPRTAAQLAQWVVERVNDWRAPLGSLDLLISPVAGDDFIPPRDRDDRALGLATCTSVQKAYGEWKRRCDRNRDNIALFYFCGHGGQKGAKLYLLCSDFGESQDNIWDGSFDFTGARDAFHACKAERQFFFVDSCRALTLGQLLYEPTPRQILQARKATDSDCPFNFTQFAAPKNESAMGPVKGISYYVQALIKAMEGPAATYDAVNGQWVVKTALLVETLEDVTTWLNFPEEYDPTFPREISRSTEILRVPWPSVPVTITCLPEDVNSRAKLACQELDMAEDEWPYNCEGGPWTLELRAKVIYKAKAELGEDGSRRSKPKLFSPQLPRDLVQVELP